MEEGGYVSEVRIRKKIMEKIVKLPRGSFYKGFYMQLTNKTKYLSLALCQILNQDPDSPISAPVANKKVVLD